MLRIALGSLAILSASLLAACQGPAGDVSVLTSDTIALRPGMTYAWGAAPNGGDARTDNSIVEQRIHTAVDQALQAKGYRPAADPGAADLIVTYHVALESRTDLQVDTFGADPVVCGLRGCFGGWGMYGYGAPDTTIREIPYVEGQLLLDLTDRATGQLAWRATSVQRVDQGESNQANINAILTDMTRDLPGVAPAASAALRSTAS